MGAWHQLAGQLAPPHDSHGGAWHRVCPTSVLPVSARAGIFLPPFDELADPRLVASLALEAEAAGWDGFFVWDHLMYRPPVTDVADPWIVLAAIAAQTRRLRLGALVTPLARRRPQVVARQVASLDHLSDGRMVFGASLGRDTSGRELSAFGEELDDRTRAAMLDEGLGLLTELWSGEPVTHAGTYYQADDVRFTPPPVQRPRVPIWIGGRWPSRPPMRRAARWDGYFPIDLGSPHDLAEVATAIRALRGTMAGFDLVVELAPDADPEPWVRAGATWWLASFGIETASPDAVRARILAGPDPPAQPAKS